MQEKYKPKALTRSLWPRGAENGIWNIVEQDAGRAMQNSWGRAGENFSQPCTYHLLNLWTIKTEENGFLLPPILMTRNAMEIGINQGFTLNPGLFVGRINLKSHENITSKDLRVTVSIGVSHVERDTYCLNMGRISGRSCRQPRQTNCLWLTRHDIETLLWDISQPNCLKSCVSAKIILLTGN